MEIWSHDKASFSRRRRDLLHLCPLGLFESWMNWLVNKVNTKSAICVYFSLGAVKTCMGQKGQEVVHVASQWQYSLCDEQEQKFWQQLWKHHQWSYLPCSQHVILASPTQTLVSLVSSISNLGPGVSSLSNISSYSDASAGVNSWRCTFVKGSKGSRGRQPQYRLASVLFYILEGQVNWLWGSVDCA